MDNLIDPIFRKINILFVFSFKNASSDPTRGSFDKYYMSSVEVKDFIALIYNILFFDQPVKTNKRCIKNFLK